MAKPLTGRRLWIDPDADAAQARRLIFLAGGEATSTFDESLFAVITEARPPEAVMAERIGLPILTPVDAVRQIRAEFAAQAMVVDLRDDAPQVHYLPEMNYSPEMDGEAGDPSIQAASKRAPASHMRVISVAGLGQSAQSHVGSRWYERHLVVGAALAATGFVCGVTIGIWLPV
ncbi:MAG: hypothetical protein ACI8TP_001315 [Acidimicrobiales bacterium]|jgi:hypothetical protein